MLAIATRLVLLLAVLIQYTPVRVCTIEQVALGSSCHDQIVAVDEKHADERPKQCGSQADPSHDCICGQAKVDGQHHVKAQHGTLGWPDLPVSRTLFSANACVTPSPDAGAERPPNPAPARQLPLLI